MTRSQIKFFSCLLFSIFAISQSFAQEEINMSEERDYKVRPVRLGLKLGFPNLIGGNLEYVTPLLNDRLALSVDYSSIKSDWFMSGEEDETETSEVNFTYIEGGLNYYFFKAGKGLYGGVSYSKFQIEATTLEENDNGIDGTGTVDYSNNSFNVKLGARIGGLFYLRPEIGYAFTSLPQTVDYQVRYSDGTTETETYDLVEELAVPDIFFKGFTANIGIGFAF